MDPRPADPSQPLSVEMRSTSGQPLVGLVEAIRRETAGTALVANFPLEVSAAFPIGEAVALRLENEAGTKPLRVRGRVVFWAENALFQRYEFQFDEETSQRLGPAFNRRESIRVTPSPTARVLGQLWHVDRWVEASGIRDVSAGGVSMLLADEDPGGLAGDRHVRIRIRLPHETEWIEAVGRVRFRRLSGAVVVYGVEFDPLRTTDCAELRRRVHAYVMQRQLEVLRSCRPTG